MACKIISLLLLLPCCLSCRPLVREELNKDDTKLMVHIFGQPLAKEIQLKSVSHRTNNFDMARMDAVYEVSTTTETLSKAITAGLMTKETFGNLSEYEIKYAMMAFFRKTTYSGYEIKDKMESGLIGIYHGCGWRLYNDHSSKPPTCLLYIISSDLLSRI